MQNSTTAETIESKPSSLHLYYYDQVNGNMSSYVFSKTGKTYLKPLTTRFFYVASNSTEVILNITYGNTKWAMQSASIGLITILLVSIISFVI